MNENPSGNGEAKGSPARIRSFRKWQPTLVLSPAQARRQSDVLRYAHQNLASPDITVAFLNSSISIWTACPSSWRFRAMRACSGSSSF